MNLLQYRELKAQEAKQEPQTPETTPVQPERVLEQPNQEPVKEEPKLPEKLVIDGIGEVTLEELKNGYLRQSDYTQKTQEVSKQRKESNEAIAFYEHLKQNPELAEQLKLSTGLPPSVDPATAKVVELETKLYDLMLNQELTQLQSEFKDFEVREVLKTAKEKNITNLRDAYFLTKSTKSVDPAVIEKELRTKILQELEAEKNGTQTMISTNSGTKPVEASIPTISRAEQKVARGQGLTDAEYVKWRDATIKPK